MYQHLATGHVVLTKEDGLAIGRLHKQGVTVLMIEDIVPLIAALSHRLVVLNFGRKIAEGPPDAVTRDPAVIEAYLGVEAPVA